MKCCICGETFEGYGNNPFPLVHRDDYSSRCCDDCNEYVIRARMGRLHKLDINIKASDEELTSFLEDKYIVIFWATNSEEPIERIANNGTFLAGSKVEGGQVVNKKVMGTWGNFLLDLEQDNYIVIEHF